MMKNSPGPSRERYLPSRRITTLSHWSATLMARAHTARAKLKPPTSAAPIMAEELYKPKAIKPPTTIIAKKTSAGKELPFLILKPP